MIPHYCEKTGTWINLEQITHIEGNNLGIFTTGRRVDIQREDWAPLMEVIHQIASIEAEARRTALRLSSRTHQEPVKAVPCHSKPKSAANQAPDSGKGPSL